MAADLYGCVAGIPGVALSQRLAACAGGYFVLASMQRQFSTIPSVRVMDVIERFLSRILPEAYIVILLTVIIAFVHLSPLDRAENLQDGLHSSLLITNWLYYNKAADYFARGAESSAFLQFWSLSLTAQVYVCGACVYGALSKLTARCRFLSYDIICTAVHAVIFIFSAWHTVHSIASATFLSSYFNPGLWLWMFASGSLASRAVRSLQVPAGVSKLAAWLANITLFATVASAGCLGVISLPFQPALMLVCLLIVIAGSTPHPSRAMWLYTRPTLVHIGNISYVTFLIHWPLILAYMQFTGSFTIGLLEGVGLTAAVLAVSHGLHIGFAAIRTLGAPHECAQAISSQTAASGDNYGAVASSGPLVPQSAPDGGARAAPSSSGLPKWTLFVPPLLLALHTAVTATSGTMRTSEATAVSCSDVGSGRHPGAMILLGDLYSTLNAARLAEPFIPSLKDAVKDQAFLYTGCHAPPGTNSTTQCFYGVPGGHPRIAMMGSSHMAQWQPAFEVLAVQYGWELHLMTKSSCDFFPRTLSPDCVAWLAAATAQLVADPVDFIIVKSSVVSKGREWRMDAATSHAFYSRLRAVNTTIVALRDTPTGGFDVPRCIMAHGVNSPKCKVSAGIYTAAMTQELAADPAFTFVDTSPFFCSRSSCDPIVGNVLVYRDSNHVSATYMRTLVPLLEALLLERVPRMMQRSAGGNRSRLAFPAVHDDVRTKKSQMQVPVAAPVEIPEVRQQRKTVSPPVLTQP